MKHVVDRSVLHKFGFVQADLSLNLIERNPEFLPYLKEREPEIADKIDVLLKTGWAWDAVVSLETSEEVPVYDLTVPGPEAFVANGLVVHNCKHKNPGSPSCHKPTEEYLKKAKLVTDFANALLVQKVASRFMVAMSLPEDVESKLMRWRHEKDQVLNAIVDGAQGVDDLLRDFKTIEREVPHDRDLRQVIRPDVQDADTLMKLVEDLGELGVVV
jgi:hypothetical protein